MPGKVWKRGKVYWIRFGYKGEEYRHSAKTENKRDAERLLVHYLNLCARVNFTDSMTKQSFPLIV